LRYPVNTESTEQWRPMLRIALEFLFLRHILEEVDCTMIDAPILRIALAGRVFAVIGGRAISMQRYSRSVDVHEGFRCL